MELERRALGSFMSSKDVYPRLAVILWFRLEIARFTAWLVEDGWLLAWSGTVGGCREGGRGPAG